MRYLRQKSLGGSFAVCALLLLCTAPISPAEAEESATGWLSTILSVVRTAGDAPVNVPKRRQSVPPPSAAAPDEGDEQRESVESMRNAAIPENAPSDTPERVLTGGAPPAASAPLEVQTALAAYLAVQDMIAEIDILREELGIDDIPIEVELMERHAPIHVYSKSLEVLAKVISVQRRLGLPAGSIGQIPFKDIDSADVLASFTYIIDELRQIKAQMGIHRQIVPASRESGVSPATIYKMLGDASFRLDGLRGQSLSPNDVYRIGALILDEMALIAQKFDVRLTFESAPLTVSKYPIDVATQIARALHKAAELQSRLQMDVSNIPKPKLVRVTPSENYDAINMLLAELARIKLHLGIDVRRDDYPTRPQDKGSGDVFAMVRLIVHNLDKLSRAASVHSLNRLSLATSG